MNIEDFKIEIKDINKEKGVVYVNVTVLKSFVTRGWVVRRSQYALPNGLYWWVTPPSRQVSNGAWFQIIRIEDLDFWNELQCEIAKLVDSNSKFKNEEITDEDYKKIDSGIGNY